MFRELQSFIIPSTNRALFSEGKKKRYDIWSFPYQALAAATTADEVLEVHWRGGAEFFVRGR